MSEFEVKTYCTSKVVLEAGEYTAEDLIAIIEAMGQLNQLNRARIDAVMLQSSLKGLKKRSNT